MSRRPWKIRAIGMLTAVICLGTLTTSLKAQPMPLNSPDRVSGTAIQVVDLRKAASEEELNKARTAYRQGHIVRILDGTSDDLRRSLGTDAFEVRTRRPVAKTARERMIPDGHAAAVRLGKNGEPHQFTSLVPAGAPQSLIQKAEERFERWRQKQTGLGDDSGPQQQYWTLVWETTYVEGSPGGDEDWGSVQYVVQVYRLNASNLDGDYYMVLTSPESDPNFKVPFSNCASAYFADCGWYTQHRTVSMSTEPAAILFDHGPTTKITSGTNTFSLGGQIPIGANVSWGYTWSQDSVTTTDQSNLAAGIGQWDEQFQDESSGKYLPGTSISTFLSHQGAIFKFPTGTQSFRLNVVFDTSIIYQPAFNNPKGGGGSVTFAVAISPPRLSIAPTSIMIAPGATGTAQVVADIAGGLLGLPWSIKDVPLWLNLSHTSGAATTLLNVTVSQGTPLGSLVTLKLNTDPPFASPDVETGEITMDVKVGQPDLHGVLLVGGSNRLAFKDAPNGTGLLYNVGANQFSGVSPMRQARAYHTSTILTDGTVLVTGGLIKGDDNYSALATAEIYDPSTGTFSLLSPSCPGAKGCLVTPGSGRVATKLANGKVLITGGISINQSCLAAAEVYDPATQLFTAAADMLTPRCSHTATLLPTGEVLIAGGFSVFTPSEQVVTTAELFDPVTNTFRLAAAPRTSSYSGTATLTKNVVLLAGGTQENAISALAQTYSSGSFQTVGPMNQARSAHTATPLPDGKILIVGGFQGLGVDYKNLATAEIFDPATQTFTTVSGSASCPGSTGCLLAPRSYHTATTLVDGRVFISGGVTDDSGVALTTTEIFDPATLTFSAGPNFDGRVSHTATIVRDRSAATIQSSQNPSTDSQPVTFTATVTVSKPEVLSGTVTFYDGPAVLGTALLANGKAALTVILKEGQHAVSASYEGNEFYGPNLSTPVLQQVNITPTSMILSTSQNPSQFGQSVTLTAKLTAPGTVDPTGTVRFYDRGNLVGTVPVTQRSAMLTLNNLTHGNHLMTASYSGDSSYAADNSNNVIQVVEGVTAQVTLTSSGSPAPFGAPVVFRAQVTVPQTPGTAPTGKIVFTDGFVHGGTTGTPIGDTQLINGSASITTTMLSSGSHSIAAIYIGDDTYELSISPVITQVIGAAPTTTTLTPVKNPIFYGQDPVALIVTVATPDATKATGSVSLMEGSNTLTTGTLDQNGQATLIYQQGLNSGIHSLTAAFAGSSTLKSSTSQIVKLTVESAPSKTSLSVSPSSPAPYGQSITLTATVQGGTGKPTGTVTFLDGAKTLGTAPVNAGTAIFSTTTLSQGTHSLSATYGGDTNYVGSQAAAIGMVITTAQPTITLKSSANPAAFGQPLTLTVTATSDVGTPTGKVTIYQGGSHIALLDLNSGVATYNLPNLAPGTYSLYAEYQGDNNFAIKLSNQISQVISPATATIALSSSLNPSPSKTPVVFTARISGLSSSPPTGTLLLYDGDQGIDAAIINAGQSVFTTSVLSVGTHNISVKWSGDSNYPATTSNIVTQVVSSTTNPVTVTLTSSKNPSLVGDGITLSARVQGSGSGGGTPTGVITFYDGTTSLGQLVLTNGVANAPVAMRTAGTHVITAAYGGDTNFQSGASNPVNQVVSASLTSTVTLTSLPNPSQLGSPVALTAQVQSNSGTPTGNVTFTDGGIPIGTTALVNGTAIFTTSQLSAGTHSLVAMYAGDSTYPAATSAVLPQQVNRVASLVGLSSTPNPSNLNQQVIFKAVVTSGAGTPTGSVTFQDGTTSLGTVALNAGVATLTTSTLSGGSHNITAVYSGDVNNTGGISHVYTQVVNTLFPASITLTSTPNPSTTGQIVTFTATVTSTGGGIPTGSVTLSEGAVIYGSSPLTDGKAVITVPGLTPGIHPIAGTYGGDATHTGATSGTLQQQVNASTGVR